MVKQTIKQQDTCLFYIVGRTIIEKYLSSNYQANVKQAKKHQENSNHMTEMLSERSLKFDGPTVKHNLMLYRL